MVKLNKIATYLNQYITGAVYDAPNVLEAYATDCSVLKIRPRVVALPKTTHDVRQLVRFSNQLAIRNFKLPITVRGTGLDKTGAAIGSGMIVSMEAMNNIQEIDQRQRLVRVQTGVTLGQLNSALSLQGLVLPVSGDPRQTIGGLLANDYTGALAGKYGQLKERVSQAEIVLSNGDLVQTERLSPRQFNKKKGIVGLEGELYRKLDHLLTDNEGTPERVAGRTGYPGLDQAKAKNGSFDLLPIFFGSQGTLGIITEVIISCELMVDPPEYFVAAYADVSAGLDFMRQTSELDPSEINFYDLTLLKETIASGKAFRALKHLPDNGILVVVSFDDFNNRRRRKKLKTIAKLNQARHFAVSTPENYGDFVELSSIMSVYLNSLTRAVRAPLVDNTFIPETQLKKYFSGLVELEQKHGISLPVFGSFLSDDYSVRPEIDLTSVTGRQFVLAFLRDYNELVNACDGSLAGGSAEGRLKAVCTNSYLSTELALIYQELKTLFDPNEIFNPNIKLDASLRSVVRQLRTSYNSGITA